MDIENNEVVNSKVKKTFRFLLELIKIALIAFAIVAPIRYFLFQPFIVSGSSMVPNLQDGNYLIIDEISYRFSDPKRGDVIVFNAGFIPGYTDQKFIKRIIGLPGETVDIIDGKVKITKDGKTTILSEKYLPADLKTYGIVDTKLKADEYFVLGDNRQYSYDSRIWGVVPKNSIVGKALIRLLPVTSFTAISTPSY